MGDEEYEQIADALTAPNGLWIYGLEDSYVYNGLPVEPEFQVFAGNARLRLGKEYAVSYKNNNKPGTALLTVTGKGSYSGKAEKEFTIIASSAAGTNDIKKAKITDMPKSKPFTGLPVTLDDKELTVTFNDEKLTRDEDYTLSYTKNIDAGTATVFITGKGNYKNSVKKTFKITPIDLAAEDKAGHISVMKTEPEYSPNGAIAELLVTWEYGEGDDEVWLTLRNGVDYKLAYSANKAVGEDQGQVKITGQGNFTKFTTRSFTIVSGDLSRLYMNAPDVPYKAKQKGTYFMSKVKIYGTDGKALKEKKDYTLSYLDLNTGEELTKDSVVNDGDVIRVTASGLENGPYAGTKLSADYRIRTLKDISKQTDIKS